MVDDIKLGDELTRDCKHVADSPLVQLFRGEDDHLRGWKGNNVVSGKLIKPTNDWFSDELAHEVEQCFPESKYSVGPQGRLLRMALRDINDLSPTCYLLGNLNFKVDALSGNAIETWPSPGQKLYYRGQTNYPTMRDPTDPAKGCSGWDDYIKWAFKRSNGGSHGTCGNFTGTCGTVDYNSQGDGEILETGDIVGGVIIDFPANESFTELVNYTAIITGCCIPLATGNTIIIDCWYTFCVYPEGSEPTGNPGP